MKSKQTLRLEAASRLEAHIACLEKSSKAPPDRQRRYLLSLGVPLQDEHDEAILKRKLTTANLDLRRLQEKLS